MHKITTKIGDKTIAWLFNYEWDFRLYTEQILPNTGINYDIVNVDIPDFIVSVYYEFINIPKCKELAFKVSAECGERFRKVPNCFQFVNFPKQEDDMNFTRYTWAFTHWSGPHSVAKTKKISIVESGRWDHRNAKISELYDKVGGIDFYGKFGNKPLSGHHQPEINEKYRGIEDYAFYFSMEHTVADDYMTEKVIDALICESIPIYIGAPNASLYLNDGCYINWDDVEKIDWNNWDKEYEKRKEYVLQQKEFILKKLNVFSYFNTITDDLSLLNKVRPITLT